MTQLKIEDFSRTKDWVIKEKLVLSKQMGVWIELFRNHRLKTICTGLVISFGGNDRLSMSLHCPAGGQGWNWEFALVALYIIHEWLAEHLCNIAISKITPSYVWTGQEWMFLQKNGVKGTPHWRLEGTQLFNNPDCTLENVTEAQASFCIFFLK